MDQFAVYENPPSELTCKSWCIYSIKDKKFLSGNNHNAQLQIASLTKMMTFILVLRFCKKYDINIDRVELVGTTAGLKHGDQITIKNLLYCLMLPSGNDAALCLAESIGSLIYKMQKGRLKQNASLKNLLIIDIQQEQTAIQSCSAMSFVNEMNNTAIELGLKESKFSNPHGLQDKVNVSSARDMALLTLEILKEENTALNICQIKSYTIEAKNIIDNSIRQILLVNTNKLLEQQGYLGMKTGYTTQAGGCLSSLYKQYEKRMAYTIEIIMVVLKSESMEHRFSDTQLLLDWYYRQLQHKINERCKFYETSIQKMTVSQS